MVDGCDGRAVKAYPRHFSVGTGRMTADVRNDLFVCPEHQRIIGRRMRLGQIGLLAIVAAPILLLVVYKTTGSGGSWPLILGAGGVIAAVFWSITATIKLEKKQEFIEQVKGEYGSVWHEDVYCR